MNIFLKQEDFLGHSAYDYDVEIIINFLKENNITVDGFRYVGKCDGTCENCGNNDFNIWREDVFYDQVNNHFAMVNDDDETIKIVDFSIYICNVCGKWSTYIE